MRKVKTIEHTGAGYRAVIYTDDDNASGYGDNAMIGFWYGTREECEAVPFDAVELHPYDTPPQVDPFDLACERRHD